jgi:hypothetical protein
MHKGNKLNINLIIMKTFLIKCEHNIYIDNYEQGEGENVNNFDTKGTFKAENATEAISKHLSSLGYSFNPKYMQVDEEDGQKNKVWYSVMVDAEDFEASESQKTNWRKNKLILYSANLTIYVYEIIPSKI